MRLFTKPAIVRKATIATITLILLITLATVGCGAQDARNSLDEEVLSNMDILAVVCSSQNSTQYESTSGNKTTGTSEYAIIDYYDAKTGDCFGDEMISAGRRMRYMYLRTRTSSSPKR